MATAALVRDIFGSDSDSDADDAARATAAVNGDAIESAPTRAPFTSSLELDDEDDEYDDDGARKKVDSAPLDIDLASDARADARETGETAKIAKLSNIFGVAAAAFDASTHVDETTTVVDADGVERFKASDENVVRWRTNPETGAPESNARVVRWSDGSTHLVIGDEYLKLNERNVADVDSFLYRRAPGLMKAHQRLKTKMTFAPATLESRTHKRLTAAIDKKHGSRATRTMEYVSRVDPEREKEALDAELERAARENAALLRKQQRMMREDRERSGVAAEASYRAGVDRGYTESYYERRSATRETDGDGDDDADAGADAGGDRMDVNFLEADEEDAEAADAEKDADEDDAPKARRKRAFVEDDEE